MRPTRHVPLTDDWQEVAIGACYLEASYMALIHFGSEAPPAETPGRHELNVEKPDFSYGGAQKCFARKNVNYDCYLIVTEG